MKKVTWPTKEQTINYSILVIALSLGLAVFFAVLDYGFSTAITALISR
jgi:preprotein translocase SecE subunit